MENRRFFSLPYTTSKGKTSSEFFGWDKRTGRPIYGPVPAAAFPTRSAAVLRPHPPPSSRAPSRCVIPAKAGIHSAESSATCGFWIPASAGMTESLARFRPVSQIRTRPRCLSRKTCTSRPQRDAMPPRCPWQPASGLVGPTCYRAPRRRYSLVRRLPSRQTQVTSSTCDLSGSASMSRSNS